VDWRHPPAEGGRSRRRVPPPHSRVVRVIDDDDDDPDSDPRATIGYVKVPVRLSETTSSFL